MTIEWDPRKATSNLSKHGVSFAEAATALFDERAMTREDAVATEEQRFVTLGRSSRGLLLVVIYTHREPDCYRIISAW